MFCKLDSDNLDKTARRVHSDRKALISLSMKCEVESVFCILRCSKVQQSSMKFPMKFKNATIDIVGMSLFLTLLMCIIRSCVSGLVAMANGRGRAMHGCTRANRFRRLDFLPLCNASWMFPMAWTQVRATIHRCNFPTTTSLPTRWCGATSYPSLC